MGGRIQKEGDRFIPSRIDQSDEFGNMLAGELRIDGAVGLYLLGSATTFLFSGGVTQPVNGMTKYPGLVPSEASVYAAAFRERLRDLRENPTYAAKIARLQPPKILLEELSYDTETNVQAASQKVKQNGWEKVAIVTNVYHERRVKLFTDTSDPSLQVFAAESWALEAFGDEQTRKNVQAYLSYDPAHRIRSRFGTERIGETDLQHGRYISSRRPQEAEVEILRGTNFLITPATQTDIPTIEAFRAEAVDWLQERGSDQWTNAPSIQLLRNRIDAGSVYMLRDGRKPIGSITLESTGDPDFWTPEELAERALYFHKLSVLRKYKGKSVGAKLIDWASEQAARDNRLWLRADCWRTNTDLHSYYSEQGFTHLRTENVPGRNSGALFQRAVQEKS